jgi:hypothetical protein
MSPAEKKFWIRAIKRDIGERALPAGKEVNFYFAKPFMRGRVQTGPRQLKALEVDYNDSSTLTWRHPGIFQQRKSYD